MKEIDELILAINSLRNDVISHDKLKTIKERINIIISSSDISNKAICRNFYYTKNYDKLPFGCIVTPIFNQGDVVNILLGDDNIKISEYNVEIDSKLFDYGLSNDQIVEVIMYNIFHLVNGKEPIDRVREAIDAYFANNDSYLIIKDSIQYEAILEFGFIDALVKYTNCLYLEDDIDSDPFLDGLELHDFDETLNILFQQIPGCHNTVTTQTNFSMLTWALRLYNNVTTERIAAIHLLKIAKDCTASVLYKNNCDVAINALNRIDTTNYLSEATAHIFSEASKHKSLFSRLKYDGLRSIEEDFYEFMVRARNADTEDEVLYALKQINIRLSILDDYIKREDISDDERERWRNLYNKYSEIRDEISKKKVYNKRNYGVFVDYNKIDQMDNPNGEDYSM